jgi:cytochrome b561
LKNLCHMALTAAMAAGPVAGWAGDADADDRAVADLAWPLDPWPALPEHAASDRHSAAHAASVASRAAGAQSQRGCLMGEILPSIR